MPLGYSYVGKLPNNIQISRLSVQIRKLNWHQPTPLVHESENDLLQEPETQVLAVLGQLNSLQNKRNQRLNITSSCIYLHQNGPLKQY